MHLRLLIVSILFLSLIWPSKGQRSNSNSRGNVFGNGRGNSPSTSNKPDGSKPNKSKDPDEELDTDNEEVFKCPRGDGLYADPISCKKFYLCGAWKSYHQNCPPSLYFDDKLKFCTFKTSELKCGPIESTEPEEDNEKFNQEKLPSCDRKACQLPNCWCSEDGTFIPGNLQANEIPQFVLLGFAGAVNELVFEAYKKVLGYSGKYNPTQSRLNPGNQCGIKGTFFINHEYSNYAEILWFASQGHEIALHSITHRQPETWWTETANYSDYAEEMIGLREILIKFANGGNDGPLNRNNVIGMRAPYIKPGGDAMFEVAHDFGMAYDSSLVAPKANLPYWPFTWDYKQPFECSNQKQKNSNSATENAENAENAASIADSIHSRGGQPVSSPSNTRLKRNTPYLGRPLHCPTKPYPGLWEIPVNPLFNEYNTCPTADQCHFSYQNPDDLDDSDDIVTFLQENFDHHYQTNKAPLQLNFHVNWFTSKNKVKGLSKFIENILAKYSDVYFVTYQQLVDWLRQPVSMKEYKLPCETKNASLACNRPHTCVVKHHLNDKNEAANSENAVRTETRYMPVCHPTSCPSNYPWFGNIHGNSKNFKTIMQLLEESTTSNSNK